MADGRSLKLTILGDAKSALKALDKTHSRLGTFGSAAKKAAKAAGALTLAGGAALAGGLALSIKAYAESGDQLHKMSQRTGIAVEALSELKHAAGLSGTSVEAVEKAVKRMASTIEDGKDGLSTTARAFDKLGISVDSLRTLNPEAQFNLIASALADVDDASTRAALAQDVFGKAGTDLLPMLASGSSGLAAMRAEARELGIVLSQEDANAAAEFNDNMQRLWERVDAAKFAIARNLIPVLIDAQEWLGPRLSVAGERAREALARIQKWIEEHREEIRRFFERSREVAEALWQNFQRGVETVLPLLIKLGRWIVDNKPVLIVAIAAVGTAIALALGPGTLAILAITGMITAIGYLRDNWDTISDAISDRVARLAGWIKDHMLLLSLLLGPFGPVLVAVYKWRDGIKSAFDAVWGVIDRVAGWIVDRINQVRDAIASMPSVSDIPGAGIVSAGVSAAGRIFPGRANGGPVSAGVAYRVGERGPETFVSSVPGRIIPAGAGGGVTVHVHVGSALGSVREIEDAVVSAVRRARARGEAV